MARKSSSRAVAIVHARTRSLITRDYTMQWYKFSASGRPGNATLKATEITREEALDYIENHELIEAHKTRDGEVYDTPAGDFKALFPYGLPSAEYNKLNYRGI